MESTALATTAVRLAAGWKMLKGICPGPVGMLHALGQLRSLELQVMPTAIDEHAGLGGPFILLTPHGRPQVAYVEVQNVSRLVTDPDEVRILAARYGSIRAQALNPSDSLAAIEELLGAG